MALGVADLTAQPGGVFVTGTAFKAILAHELAWKSWAVEARLCERLTDGDVRASGAPKP